MSSCETGTVSIIKGEDKTITARIVTDPDGEPLDLTGYTTISAMFKNQDNSILTVTSPGSITLVGNAVLGKIDITLTDAQTALMKKGTMSFDVQIDIGTTRKLVTFENVLIISDKFTA